MHLKGQELPEVGQIGTFITLFFGTVEELEYFTDYLHFFDLSQK
jgi:hypothetical protein